MNFQGKFLNILSRLSQHLVFISTFLNESTCLAAAASLAQGAEGGQKEYHQNTNQEINAWNVIVMG